MSAQPYFRLMAEKWKRLAEQDTAL
jgi:hypothetical protein